MNMDDESNKDLLARIAKLESRLTKAAEVCMKYRKELGEARLTIEAQQALIIRQASEL